MMAPLLASTTSHRSWSVCTCMGLLSQRTRTQRGKRSECREANVLLMMVRTSAWICACHGEHVKACCMHAPGAGCTGIHFIVRNEITGRVEGRKATGILMSLAAAA